MWELFISVVVVAAIAAFFLWEKVTLEGYMLRKLINSTNEQFFKDMFDPGLRLVDGARQIHEPVHAKAAEVFIRTCLQNNQDPARLQVVAAIQTHKRLVEMKPTGIEISLGYDAGCWNYVTYVFEGHTVLFYITIE